MRHPRHRPYTLHEARPILDGVPQFVGSMREIDHHPSVDDDVAGEQLALDRRVVRRRGDVGGGCAVEMTCRSTVGKLGARAQQRARAVEDPKCRLGEQTHLGAK